jgi:co-chaperonin GroES (HSP10)
MKSSGPAPSYPGQTKGRNNVGLPGIPAGAVQVAPQAPITVNEKTHVPEGGTPAAKKWSPTRDLVAFQLLLPPFQSDGGVILPETARANWKTAVGVLIAAGPEVRDNRLRTPGVRFLIGPSEATHRVKFDGDEVLVVPEGSILAVVDEGYGPVCAGVCCPPPYEAPPPDKAVLIQKTDAP